MALYQFLCGLTVVISLLSEGCHAQQPACGMAPSNTKIVGGQDATPGSWPWQVSIHNLYGHWCGGSLITSEWVLTAAHCITSDMQAYLGRHNQSDPNPNEVLLEIDDIESHPSYDSYTFDNDIALLKLSAPVNFTDYIYPVCLASEDSTIYPLTSSWITGWGATENGYPDILQEVNVPIVGNDMCRCAYPYLTANMICAGLKEGGKDSCQGDSGGPLLTKNGSVWIQIGVVSFGQGCGEPLFPGVYARVSRYQEWISSITGSSEPGFVTFTSTGPEPVENSTCPTGFPYTTDDSIFGGGENMIHSSHFTYFISLCALVLSLYGW